MSHDRNKEGVPVLKFRALRKCLFSYLKIICRMVEFSSPFLNPRTLISLQLTTFFLLLFNLERVLTKYTDEDFVIDMRYVTTNGCNKFYCYLS